MRAKRAKPLRRAANAAGCEYKLRRIKSTGMIIGNAIRAFKRGRFDERAAHVALHERLKIGAAEIEQNNERIRQGVLDAQNRAYSNFRAIILSRTGRRSRRRRLEVAA